MAQDSVARLEHAAPYDGESEATAAPESPEREPCGCPTLPELAEIVSGATAGRLVQAVQAATDSNGNACINWPVAFSGTPVVVLALQTSVAEAHTARITANSASGAGVHVARYPLVSALGITAPTVNASGVIVHAVAVGEP